MGNDCTGLQVSSLLLRQFIRSCRPLSSKQPRQDCVLFLEVLLEDCKRPSAKREYEYRHAFDRSCRLPNSTFFSRRAQSLTPTPEPPNPILFSSQPSHWDPCHSVPMILNTQSKLCSIKIIAIPLTSFSQSPSLPQKPPPSLACFESADRMGR